MSFRKLLSSVAAVLTLTGFASHSNADGHIDATTLVSTSQGTYRGIAYRRYEAMFTGVSSANRPYRVPCQIIAPIHHGQASGLLLFDWLVPSTIPTAVGQEQADARYTLTDNFLFGLGTSYATVRCNPVGIGMKSSVPNPARPWSDGLLNTSSEFITSPGDEFDIVVDYVKALKTDPVARAALGQIRRNAAFGYSASGYRLRGLVRIPQGKHLFSFSLVGGTGYGYDYPDGDDIATSEVERAPLPGAGLEIDFQSETDCVVLGAENTRHEEPNYRVYQFAGASHIRNLDVAEFGLPDPEIANPAEWTPFFRALFVAANKWCDGVPPPPSIWLGAPGSPDITRDAKGNALVRFVGRYPVNTPAFRLPEVAVGQNQYIPFDPSYLDGSFLGLLRAIGGGHVDLTSTFPNHIAYVLMVKAHARLLQGFGYLLDTDADAIILRALQSNIGG